MKRSRLPSLTTAPPPDGLPRQEQQPRAGSGGSGLATSGPQTGSQQQPQHQQQPLPPQNSFLLQVFFPEGNINNNATGGDAMGGGGKSPRYFGEEAQGTDIFSSFVDNHNPFSPIGGEVPRRRSTVANFNLVDDGAKQQQAAAGEGSTTGGKDTPAVINGGAAAEGGSNGTCEPVAAKQERRRSTAFSPTMTLDFPTSYKRPGASKPPQLLRINHMSTATVIDLLEQLDIIRQSDGEDIEIARQLVEVRPALGDGSPSLSFPDLLSKTCFTLPLKECPGMTFPFAVCVVKSRLAKEAEEKKKLEAALSEAANANAAAAAAAGRRKSSIAPFGGRSGSIFGRGGDSSVIVKQETELQIGLSVVGPSPDKSNRRGSTVVTPATNCCLSAGAPSSTGKSPSPNPLSSCDVGGNEEQHITVEELMQEDEEEEKKLANLEAAGTTTSQKSPSPLSLEAVQEQQKGMSPAKLRKVRRKAAEEERRRIATLEQRRAQALADKEVRRKQKEAEQRREAEEREQLRRQKRTEELEKEEELRLRIGARTQKQLASKELVEQQRREHHVQLLADLKVTSDQMKDKILRERAEKEERERREAEEDAKLREKKRALMSLDDSATDVSLQSTARVSGGVQQRTTTSVVPVLTHDQQLLELAKLSTVKNGGKQQQHLEEGGKEYPGGAEGLREVLKELDESVAKDSLVTSQLQEDGRNAKREAIRQEYHRSLMDAALETRVALKRDCKRLAAEKGLELVKFEQVRKEKEEKVLAARKLVDEERIRKFHEEKQIEEAKARKAAHDEAELQKAYERQLEQRSKEIFKMPTL